MNERMSPDEIKLAEKYIKHYQQNNKVMKYGKWLILFMAIALIGGSFYMLTQARKVGSINTPEYILKDKELGPDLLDRYIDARLKGKKLKSNLLSKYIDARIDLIRLEFGAAFKSYFGAILGGLFLGLFITTWNWHGRNRLIVKGLRMLIALSNNDQK